MSSYLEGHVKKKSSLDFMTLVVMSRCPKSGDFLENLQVLQVLKSFASRNNSLEPLAVGFSNSHPYVMEESRELRALISWVLG